MKKYIFPVLTVLTLVAGCSPSSSEDHSSGDDHGQIAPVLTYEKGSNDWSVITTNTESPKILEAYQFAVEHPEVLDYMPCYCGCFEEDGHTSNTHCFVDHVEGTTVTLDTMGFG
jgi:hypothetical protein